MPNRSAEQSRSEIVQGCRLSARRGNEAEMLATGNLSGPLWILPIRIVPPFGVSPFEGSTAAGNVSPLPIMHRSVAKHHLWSRRDVGVRVGAAPL